MAIYTGRERTLAEIKTLVADREAALAEKTTRCGDDMRNSDPFYAWGGRLGYLALMEAGWEVGSDRREPYPRGAEPPGKQRPIPMMEVGVGKRKRTVRKTRNRLVIPASDAGKPLSCEDPDRKRRNSR